MTASIAVQSNYEPSNRPLGMEKTKNKMLDNAKSKIVKSFQEMLGLVNTP